MKEKGYETAGRVETVLVVDCIKKHSLKDINIEHCTRNPIPIHHTPSKIQIGKLATYLAEVLKTVKLSSTPVQSFEVTLVYILIMSSKLIRSQNRSRFDTSRFDTSRFVCL